MHIGVMLPVILSSRGLGPELISNGTFPITSTTGWNSFRNGVGSTVDGWLRVTNGSLASSAQTQQITGLTIGTRYRIAGRIRPGDVEPDFRVGTVEGNSSILRVVNPGAEFVIEPTFWDATQDNIWFGMFTVAGTTGNFAEFTDISFRRA